MKSRSKLVLPALTGIILFAAASLYALFHGYFDHGLFEIKRSAWSSSSQVAMVSKRSDHEALGGLEYFVLIGDHVFDAVELRHAYYSDRVILDVGSGDCLTVRWDGPSHLTITCNGPTVDREHINHQRQSFGKVEISYENIALK